MEPQQADTTIEKRSKINHNIFYILIFIFLATMSSFIFTYIQNSKQYTVQNTKVSSETKNLYPELNWKKTNLNNTFDIYLDNYDYVENSTESKSKSYSIPVKVWVATTSSVKYSDFSKYYSDILVGDGWRGDRLNIPEKEYTILPLQADGPLGSSWGYIKISDGKLRLIGLSYMLTKYEDSSSSNEPIQVTCPCEYEYKVFLSDDIDLSALNLDESVSTSDKNDILEIISSNKVFIEWLKSKGVGYEQFESGNFSSHEIVFDNLNSGNRCQDAEISKKFLSPNKKYTTCFFSGEEPDSDLYLVKNDTNFSQRLAFCGTPCSYENGFWLNDHEFVFLWTFSDYEYENNNRQYKEYAVDLYDLDMMKIWRWTSVRSY